ncbi:hypothetical protein MKD14_15450 [[Clostridium] innocuum]|nr:hypothetical protein [[Clostridium] innocuum]
MQPIDATKETYELVEVDGHICAFTNARLDRETVSQSLHCYDIRDSDTCEGIFAEIKPYVLVNHWGTLLCKEPFPLEADGSYYPINEESYLSETITMSEYLQLDFNLVIENQEKGQTMK